MECKEEFWPLPSKLAIFGAKNENGFQSAFNQLASFSALTLLVGSSDL